MRHLQAERQTTKAKEDAMSEPDKLGGKPNRFVAGREDIIINGRIDGGREGDSAKAASHGAADMRMTRIITTTYRYERPTRWQWRRHGFQQQRSERNRVKQDRKDAKVHAREEAAASRKLGAEQQEELGEATPESDVGPSAGGFPYVPRPNCDAPC